MTIVNYSEVSESRRLFDIEIPAEEIDRVRQGITRNYARRAVIPGFRKGKVPETVVAKKFAGEIREEVLGQLIPEALSEAIREKGVQPIGRPVVENVQFEEGRPLAFHAKIDVRPPIEPGNYGGIEVIGQPTEPSSVEVDQALSRLRESHAEFLPVEGRLAAKGDFAIVDVAHRFVEAGSPVIYTGAGEPISNETTGEWERDEKLTLEVGHADSMPEVNDALAGAATGETRRFRKRFPPDFQNAKYAGHTLDYEVLLVALKEKKLPELDDEFAKHMAGMESLSQLREKITEGMRAEKIAAGRRTMRKEILETLLARVRIPAPEILVEAETESALEEYAAYLTANGVDPKGADWDKLAAEARPAAERRVREYLLLDEIARREALEVSETEVDAEIARSAARRGADPDAVRERLEKSGRLGSIREEIRLHKTSEWLIDHATVVAGATP